MLATTILGCAIFVLQYEQIIPLERRPVMHQTTSAAAFRYDPFSIEAMRDPQSFYPTLRDEYPAWFMPQYDGYAISRFEDVWNAFMDSVHFSESEGQLFTREQMLVHHRGDPPPPVHEPMAMFNFIDPPLHSEFRRLMAPPFAKSSVNRLEGRISALVRDRLAELIARGRFDLNADLGSYVSSMSTAIVVGMELEEAPRVLALVNRMTARSDDAPGETADGAAARAELMAFLEYMVARRRRGEGPDSRFIDGLIGTGIAGRPLTDNEIALDLISVLFGGTETVPKVLAGGLLSLWKQPDQLAAVRADPARNAAPAWEEMLRYCAPAQWFGRTAKHPVEVAGALVEPGQRVFLLIASANRDPREFDDPEALVWNRKARRLLSFGVGPHFCVGIHLARLEGQIMLRELLSAVPGFSIDQQAGRWASSEFQTGWLSLPLVVE
jgi:cytochrome P450